MSDLVCKVCRNNMGNVNLDKCTCCGSTDLSYQLVLSDRISLHDSIRGKSNKMPGKKKPFSEFQAGDEWSVARKKYVEKQRKIDRENNIYYEKVVDKETNVIIHECSEPLDEHFNHGSAKPKYELRELKKDETEYLSELLYQAIYQANEDELLPKSIIEKPELKMYISDWGKKNDLCVVAVKDDKILGAVWSRIWCENQKGFGYIDDSTPEIAMAVYNRYRRIGIGTKLLERIIEIHREKGYKNLSLSVSKGNYAVKLYEKFQFKIHKENEKELIMILML